VNLEAGLTKTIEYFDKLLARNVTSGSVKSIDAARSMPKRSV
jgi:hypothetical protein